MGMILCLNLLFKVAQLCLNKLMPAPKLYDTLSKSIKPLTQTKARDFGFYACGPTIYAEAHIGNFRTFVVQDTLRRVLELSGIKVKHVRNLTDVDDKTIRGAIAKAIPLAQFTQPWGEKFANDCQSLNLLPPHVEPSAVDHIPEQIDLVQTLIDKKIAYVGADQSVYFSINSFPNYGKLSGVDKIEINQSHHPSKSSSLDADEYDKDHISDFVLWKHRKDEDAEHFWQSPWGEGRPGWHLECSAMSLKHLPHGIDLHGGGVDLCFPHHDNEIAQSEAATGKPCAQHWFHSEHLMVEDQKMSKSLGNLYTLNQLNDTGYAPASVRYALLAGHYRKKLNFKFDLLKNAQNHLKQLGKYQQQLIDLSQSPATSYTELCVQSIDSLLINNPFASAWEALLNDLNTPEALGQTFLTLKQLDKQLKSNSLNTEQAKSYLKGLSLIIAAFGWDVTLTESETTADIPADIHALAEQRLQAKKDKDWGACDQLRDQITAQGWSIKDTPDGYELIPQN